MRDGDGSQWVNGMERYKQRGEVFLVPLSRLLFAFIKLNASKALDVDDETVTAEHGSVQTVTRDVGSERKNICEM